MPVMSLFTFASLTDGQTVQDLPKQHSCRRPKGVPYHATLDCYSGEMNENEKLKKEDNGVFRSALGLILFIAQDRPDIQFAVKILSTYMTSPCMKAMSAMEHLASYLDRTRSDGILMRNSQLYDITFNHWRGFESQQGRRDCAMYNVESFSDASWGDDRATRKSTSSGVRSHSSQWHFDLQPLQNSKYNCLLILPE